MAPRFSVVVPVDDPPTDGLTATVRSVARQSFPHWELCLVGDGSPADRVDQALDAVASADDRIRVVRRPQHGGVVQASNAGIAVATGEFVALLDQDGELHRDALRLVHEAIEQHPDADFVYTDEDELDEHGRHRAPFYKPDWSPERLRTQMYTSHLSVLRRSLVDEVGGFDAAYEGSQAWDLVLKISERARRVVHVPTVLYHGRRLRRSTSVDGTAPDPDAHDAGSRAVQAHCDRIGLHATVVPDADRAGVHHLQPALVRHPRVSIVIPTNGGRREVRAEPTTLVIHCVRSVVQTTTYPDYEVVVVADTTTPGVVLDELRAIARDRVRVIEYPHSFNFADKVNVGVLASRGEHVLMLNDDMEVVTPDWIERMVMYSSFPEIGAVGAKLLFGDGRLQHVGVMVRGASPGHLFRGFAGDYDGYADTVRVANNYTAVTGACLMARRDVFDDVGGLSTSFPLSFNDVDFCLKVQARGLRVVYDPDTVLFHFESSSRSPDVSPWELDLFQRRWRHATLLDPYDNPNFHPSSLNMVPPVYHDDGTVLL